MRRWLFPLILCFACSSEQVEAPGVATADTGPFAEYCGSASPDWGYVWADVFYAEDGPLLTVFSLPADADGGLHDVELQIWGDHLVDGQVNFRNEPAVSQRLLHGDAACGPVSGDAVLWDVPLADYGFVEGGVELALRIVDADGNASDFIYLELCLWGSDDGCAEG